MWTTTALGRNQSMTAYSMHSSVSLHSMSTEACAEVCSVSLGHVSLLEHIPKPNQ